MSERLEVRVGVDQQVTLPDGAGAFSCWIDIVANDPNGVVISNVKKGDIIEIGLINGVASFEQTTMAPVKSFIAVRAGIMKDSLDYYTLGQADETKDAIEQATKCILESLPNEIKHKPRDGYGQDPTTDEYSTTEGGIIICMPKAKGAIYATSENYLSDDAKTNGRKQEYFPENIKNVNSWFPCQLEGGIMKKQAEVDGEINILAFEQNWEDSAGDYQFRLTIVRPHESFTENDAKEKLKQIEQEYGYLDC